MPVSEARLAANRKNALLSTGPKTEEGKEHYRNSLKHGLTGAGVVIPDEDAGGGRRPIRRVRPRTSGRGDGRGRGPGPAGGHALGPAGERCVRHRGGGDHEIDARSRAGPRADRDRAERQRLVELIVARPHEAYHGLRRSPEGFELDHPGVARPQVPTCSSRPPTSGPGDAHRESTTTTSTGRRPNDFPMSRDQDDVRRRSTASSSTPAHRLARPRPAPPARQAARVELGGDHRRRGRASARPREAIDAEGGRAWVEAGEATRAIFDASKEAVLARKYEAAGRAGFLPGPPRGPRARGRNTSTPPDEPNPPAAEVPAAEALGSISPERPRRDPPTTTRRRRDRGGTTGPRESVPLAARTPRGVDLVGVSPPGG